MSKTVARQTVWSPATAEVALRRRIEKACKAYRPVLRSFAGWLRDERGVGPATARQRVDSVVLFLDAVTAHGALPCRRAFALLTAEKVEGFFVQFGEDHTRPTLGTMRSAMRLFLKFAAMRGWVGWELSAAVPGLVTWQLSGLPRGLSDEQLAILLSTPWTSGECPRRDKAIVELLATYGVRRQQVSALRLSDIDWRARTIDFAAQKGGKAIHHELSPSVAQSLSEYLRFERPSSDCAYVFLRRRRPHVRLSPMAITPVMKSRASRCGLPPCGAHVLRHTFATRLLRAGQPVKAIADLLGHRSLDAVAIYAKVDVSRLLEVAVDWPEVVP